MNDKVNIVLIGMPGCGKSTLGKALAKRLGRDFYDADDVIVEQEGKTIPELFTVSEDCFRDAEVRSSRTLAAKQGVIIACGGGVIKRPENMAILKKTGKVFFIDRSPDDIVSDVDVAVRPLLKEGRQKVYRLYEERITLYREAADYCIVNDKSMEEVLYALEALIRNI